MRVYIYTVVEELTSKSRTLQEALFRVKPPKSADDILKQIVECDSTLLSLGDASAALRLGRYYIVCPMDEKKAIEVLKGAVDAGFADLLVYTTLAFLYTTCSGNIGKEAEKYYRIASELPPTKAEEIETIDAALVSRARIYALGLSPIPADPVYAAYLSRDVLRTSLFNEDIDVLTKARMYRFGLWVECDPRHAWPMYSDILTGKKKAKQGMEGEYPEAVLREAKEFHYRMREMYEEDPLMFGENESKLCLKWLKLCLKHHPDILDLYAYIADQYMREDGANVDLKKAKEYLDQGVIHIQSKDPLTRIRLVCSLVKYYIRVGDINKVREYITLAEDSIDGLPLGTRIEVNTIAVKVHRDVSKDETRLMKVYDRVIKDCGYGCLVPKALLLMGYPDHPTEKGLQDAEQCLIEAEKCLESDMYPYRKGLIDAYIYLGNYYLPKPSLPPPLPPPPLPPPSPFPPSPVSKDEGKGKGKGEQETKYTPPTDRDKARSYYQKCLTLGSCSVWKYLGLTYYSTLNPWGKEGDDEVKAAKCYTKAIELGEGDSTCYFELAYLLLHGRGIKQDLKKATEYYKQALAEGDDKFKASISNYKREFGEKCKNIK